MATWAVDRDVTPDWKPEKRHKASWHEQQEIIKHFQDACCVHCGLPHETKHHIVPRSQGGDDVVENLAPMCGDGSRGCHGLLESHGPGWERVAASVRVYVLTDRDRCVYAIGKVGWERFNSRYPLLSEPGEAKGRQAASSPVASRDRSGPRRESVEGLPGSESDWEHWEAPDERQSPWDVAYEPTHFTEG